MKMIDNCKLFIKRIISGILRLAVRNVSSTRLYMIPHHNCAKDQYDIENYRSDNVLSLLHYMLETRGDKYEFIVESYDKSKNDAYLQYVKQINPKASIKFVCADSFLQRLKLQVCMLRSKYIFTCSYFLDFTFRKKENQTVCLSYFTPFKNDYMEDIDVSLMNQSFDHFITTSKLSSQITAVATKIDFHKFHVLGFPRNDNMKYKNKELLDFIKEKVGYTPNYLFLYTPTYRDYGEDKDSNVLGYKGDLQELNEFLLQEKAVFLFKLHPWCTATVNVDKYKAFFDVNQTKGTWGLYDYLPLADSLITDYTSTYFDFLLLDKPVIFNFYDVEKYEELRGVSYDPLESICLGDIVKNYREFIDVIKNHVRGNATLMEEERKRICPLFNKYTDFNSSERICKFFGL